MTRSIRGSRRAALLLTGVAAATGMLVSGCGAGQIAETAAKTPSIGGVNVQSPDNRYKVRSASVAFPGVEGYRAGSDAPLNLAIYNDSERAVTVRITSDSARSVTIAGPTTAPGAGPSAAVATSAPTSPTASGTPSAPSPTPTGASSPDASGSPAPAGSPEPSGSPTPAGSPEPSGSPTPSGSVTPAATASPQPPAGQPAVVEIPAQSYVLLERQAGSYLQLTGLNAALPSGGTVNLVFDFGNGVTVSTPVPVAVPLSPVPPASPIVGGDEEGAGEDHSG